MSQTPKVAKSKRVGRDRVHTITTLPEQGTPGVFDRMSAVFNQLTPRGKKVVAVGVLALVAVGLGATRHSGESKEEAPEYGYITIDNGDNATKVGRELGDGNEHISEIADEVQGQADKNGYLQPGQVVRINLDHVDHPELLMQDYDPSAHEDR